MEGNEIQKEKKAKTKKRKKKEKRGKEKEVMNNKCFRKTMNI
jgi:hypothetical protein